LATIGFVAEVEIHIRYHSIRHRAFAFDGLHVLIIENIHTLEPDSFNSLENVKLLFSNDKTLLAGWIHYLAFDLMIGSWVVQTAIERNLPHTITIFILPAVFMFGPMGYLLFQIVLFLKTKLYGATLH
jgi:hypothetical protein